MRAIIFLFSLAACATPPVSYVPVETDKPVPVYIPCQQTIPEEPLWVTKTIDPNTDIYKQSTALQGALDQHAAYEKQLKDTITVCITLSTKE